MAKLIEFSAWNDAYFDLAEKPVSAVQELPTWWKKTSRNANLLNKKPAVTVKACAPTLDAMGAGYVIKMWTDLKITRENGLVVITQAFEGDVSATTRWDSSQVSNYPIPKGHSPDVFKFHHGWVIKTPPGWSSLILPPIGHNELPFQSIPGLVDTDILKTDINTPFTIREDFEGVIPRGTPMFQVIPIKRNSWESKVYGGNTDYEDFSRNQSRLTTKFWGYYSSRRDKKQYK